MLLQDVATTLRTILTATSPFDAADSVLISGYDEDITSKIEASILARNWAILIETPAYTTFSDSMVDDAEVELNALVALSIIIDEGPESNTGLTLCGQAISAILPAGSFVLADKPLDQPFIEQGLPVYTLNFEAPVALI